MTTTNSYRLTLAVFLMSAACHPTVAPEKPVKDSRTSDSANVEPAREVGLPSIADDGECPEQLSIDLATWAALADTIVVGTVSKVEMNKEIVFAGAPPRRIDWSECNEDSVSASLRVTLSDVRSLLDDTETSEEMSFIISAPRVMTFMPRPYWSAAESKLLWGGQGQVLGAGLELGAALIWDDAYHEWSTRNVGSLFEIDPASNVIFPDDAGCITTPPEFEGRTLGEFENELSSAGEPDSDAVARFRQAMTSGDDLWRGFAYMSTHCNPSDYTEEPDPCEVEADCSGGQRCVDEICVD